MVEVKVKDKTLQFSTEPSLFSPKGLDQGTALLLSQLWRFNYETALDWGCGWGALGVSLAANNPMAKVWALDAHIGAVKATKQNAEHNKVANLTVLASDSFAELAKSLKFDLIVANPPTHMGREVVDNMITESFEHLNADGTLAIVVEARLKPWVARNMQNTFGSHKILSRGPKNVVIVAQKKV